MPLPGTSRDKAPKTAAITPGGQTPIGLPVAEEEVFEEDFTDVTSKYAVAEEGLHHAKVVGFEKTESRSGNPQYVWQFRILAGNSKGVEVKYWTSLLPQARWKVVEALEAVGVAASGSVARFKLSDIIDKPCIIEVVHEDYEGKTNHKVNKVYGPIKDTLAFMKQDESAPF